jgi:SAM-dependent methyltransferase
LANQKFIPISYIQSMKFATTSRFNEEQIDRLFDLSEKAGEWKVKPEHFGEQIIHEPTPYSYILNFLDQFKPKAGETVYDLGCGFGKVVIIGALNSDAYYKGIELVKERANRAEAIRKLLNVPNAEFHCGNVLDYDFSDGDIFFLFNPFSEKTLKAVGQILENISKNKQIKIATWGGPTNRFFDNLPWLQKVPALSPVSDKIDYYMSHYV